MGPTGGQTGIRTTSGAPATALPATTPTPEPALDAIDGPTLRAWAAVALTELRHDREGIDALNVFPVPDRDTGTNLLLTLESAVGAAAGLPSDADLPTTVRALAQGALVGARGNSGTILSQLLRGMAGTLAAQAARSTTAANGDLLVHALRSAADSAYAAVVDPVEGTMLTVARAAADAAAAAPSRDVVTVVAAAAGGAREALARTPAELDALAAAGVVDAGGQGLVVLLDALLAVVNRRAAVPARTEPVPAEPRPDPAPRPLLEVMYLLAASPAAVEALRLRLADLGDSVVVVGGNRLWSVHVHSSDAGAAIEAGLAAGRLSRVRIELLPSTPHPARALLVAVRDDAVAEALEAEGVQVVRLAPDTDIAACVLPVVAGTHAAEVVLVLRDDDAAELRAALGATAAPRVGLVPVSHDVQALAAVAVHIGQGKLETEAAAMGRAAAAMRCGALDAAESPLEQVSRLLAPTAEVVTLVGPSAGLAPVVTAVGERYPDVEVVAVPVESGGPVLVGVE